MSLLCSCNLDAQVVYRGACIFHCLAFPRAAYCGAARGIHPAECIRDVPVDVCIDEKIASVPIYRGRPPPAARPLLSSFPHFFPRPPLSLSSFFRLSLSGAFLRRARNATAVRMPFSLAYNPVRRTLRLGMGYDRFFFLIKTLRITCNQVIKSEQGRFLYYFCLRQGLAIGRNVIQSYFGLRSKLSKI